MANDSRNDVRETARVVLASRTIHFRYVTQEDAGWILELRRAPAQSGMLSETSDDVHAQRHWIADYLVRHAAGKEYYFAICHRDDLPVGTVRVHDVSSDSCWWGSWVIRPGSAVGVVLASYTMVNFFMFELLKVKEARFEVRAGNSAVVRFHESMGAKRTASQGDDLLYVTSRAWYESFKRKHETHFVHIARCAEIAS